MHCTQVYQCIRLSKYPMNINSSWLSFTIPHASTRSVLQGNPSASCKPFYCVSCIICCCKRFKISQYFLVPRLIIAPKEIYAFFPDKIPRDDLRKPDANRRENSTETVLSSAWHSFPINRALRGDLSFRGGLTGSSCVFHRTGKIPRSLANR